MGAVSACLKGHLECARGADSPVPKIPGESSRVDLSLPAAIRCPPKSVAAGRPERRISEVPLRMSPRETSGITIIDLNGRITLGEGCDGLIELFHDLMMRGQKKVLINLAEVNYIDSSGIGVLMKCFVTSKRHGGAVKLVHLNTKIRDLFQITNVYTVFEVFSDEHAATSSFV
jgi:anti-sigma B factor antagonist